MSLISVAKRNNVGSITTLYQGGFTNVTNVQYDGARLYAVEQAFVIYRLTVPTVSSTQYIGSNAQGTYNATICNSTTYTNNTFYTITDLAFDGSNNLYVADSGGVVQMFSTSGTAKACNVPFTGASAIGVSTDGTQLVGFSANNNLMYVFSNSTSGTAPFNSSWTNTYIIAPTAVQMFSKFLGWFSFAPGIGSGGTFFTGGVTTGDYIVHAVTNFQAGTVSGGNIPSSGSASAGSFGSSYGYVNIAPSDYSITGPGTQYFTIISGSGAGWNSDMVGSFFLLYAYGTYNSPRSTSDPPYDGTTGKTPKDTYIFFSNWSYGNPSNVFSGGGASIVIKKSTGPGTATFTPWSLDGQTGVNTGGSPPVYPIRGLIFTSSNTAYTAVKGGSNYLNYITSNGASSFVTSSNIMSNISNLKPTTPSNYGGLASAPVVYAASNGNVYSYITKYT